MATSRDTHRDRDDDGATQPQLVYGGHQRARLLWRDRLARGIAGVDPFGVGSTRSFSVGASAPRTGGCGCPGTARTGVVARAGGDGSSSAARRARSSSGTAPMMTAAEIAITAYSSHGVSGLRLWTARAPVPRSTSATVAATPAPSAASQTPAQAPSRMRSVRSSSPVSRPVLSRERLAASVTSGISS